MANYAVMYRRLFNAQTDAIRLQEQSLMILRKAQQDTEEMYVESPDADIRLLDTGNRDDTDKE